MTFKQVKRLINCKAARGKHAARPGVPGTAALVAPPQEQEQNTPIENPRDPVVALLYDAENIPGQNFPRAFEAARELGDVRVVRAFGNAALMATTRWQDLALAYGVDRVVCEGHVAGKNSADMRMAVDALDLLMDGSVDVFALASDDTDFAPVARRLRQGGKRVHGMGTGQSKGMYRGVYDGFSIISKRGRAGPRPPADGRSPLEKKIELRAQTCGIDPDTLELVVSCAIKGASDDGWCTIASLCRLLMKERSGFSAKRFGCKNMKAFVKKSGMFELRHERGANYIRLAS